jgi:hypothetical protein
LRSHLAHVNSSTKFKGKDAAETANNIANNIQVSDVEAIRRKISAILKTSLEEIDKVVANFKENAGAYKLKLENGKEIGMSPEVVKRNLTAFAETKRDINQITTAVLKARTMPELIMSLYGRTIQSIFETDDEEKVDESVVVGLIAKGFEMYDNRQIHVGDTYYLKKMGDKLTITDINQQNQKVSYRFQGEDTGTLHIVSRKRFKEFLKSMGAEKVGKVKESLFKTINNIAEDDPTPGAVTASSAIASNPQRLFGNRVIVRRPRKFVPKKRFARGVQESLLKLVEYDATSNFNQFATDVDDSAAAQGDIEFKQLRNNVAPGTNGNPVSQSDVSNYLDKAHELNDEVDTVTFGMEMDDGSVAKVYVNASQAEDFEKTLAELLGQEDDLEKVIDELSQNFDIVDVEWPEQYGTNAVQPGTAAPTTDSSGAPVLDPVIDLGNLDDEPSEDDGDGGLLKSINGMKNPDDIELPPGAELPPEEQGEGISPEEAEARKAAATENGEESDGTEGGEDSLMKDVNGSIGGSPTGSEEPPTDGGEDDGDLGGDEGDTKPEGDGGSGGEEPQADLGDLEEPAGEESTGSSEENNDEESNDENSDKEGGEESTPKKKKPKSSEDEETKESVMSFGQRFKDKLLLEKKEEKSSKKVVKDADAAEDAHDFPAALKKLMQFFPQRGEKMMVALMWALGAPLDAMVMKKSDMRKSVQAAGDRYQKDSQLRLWVGRVMDAMIAAESKKAVKESTKLEDELNNVLQKVVINLLDKIGMPNSIERIARIQLRANIKQKALLVQGDNKLRAYLKILAELMGVDGVTGMQLEDLDVLKEFGSEDFLNGKATAGVRPTVAANDQMHPDQQLSGVEDWISTVKQMAILFGIPEGNVNYKQTLTDASIRKRMQDIPNRGTVLRRMKQILQMVGPVQEEIELEEAKKKAVKKIEKKASPSASDLNSDKGTTKRAGTFYTGSETVTADDNFLDDGSETPDNVDTKKKTKKK